MTALQRNRLQSQPPVLDLAQSASSPPMGPVTQTPAPAFLPAIPRHGRRDPSTSA